MAAAKRSAKDVVGSLSPNAIVVTVWVVLVVGIIAAYYFLFFEPLSEERTAEEGRRTTLAASKTREEQNLRRYNSDVAELARARQRAQALESVLPNDADIPGFMRSINSLAETSGLRISLIQPTEERVERYYARIPVQLSVRGTYLSLARFFHAVSQLPRVINMENIKLTQPTIDATTQEWSLASTVLATTFRGVPQGAARPAGAAGAANANAGANAAGRAP